MSNTNSNRRTNEDEGQGENPPATNAENAPAPAAARPRQSAWETFKSFAFRMLMFYFITSFFRRSPTNSTGNNGTMPLNPQGGTYSPGNLYANGDLMDLYLFLNENEKYQFDSQQKPIWQIDGWKYGDWSSKGTLTKFIEFPISDVKFFFCLTFCFLDENFSIRLECEKQRIVIFTRHRDATRPFDRSD